MDDSLDIIQNLDPRKLAPSPLNPRRTTGNLDDLTASIRSQGILEPLVVRRRAAGYEVILGHRRRAAAIQAEQDRVPCLIRKATDDEVLDMMAVENNQREDISPIDEAVGFDRMIQRGRSPAEVASTIGRPTSYVVGRLKLLDLSPKVKKCVDDGSMTIGVAMEVAKLPTKKLQDVAAKLCDGWPHHQVMTVEGARREIEGRVMRSLEGMPFSLDDEKLLPSAGSCTRCPNRTGAQADLFGSASSADLCTLPSCLDKKLKAHWKVVTRAAKKDGIRILSQADAAKTRVYGGKFVTADQGMNRANWTTIEAGKVMKGKEPYAKALDPQTLRPVDVYLRKDVEAEVRALDKVKKKGPGTTSDSSFRDQTRRLKEARRVDALVADATTSALEQAATSHSIGKAAWAVIVREVGDAQDAAVRHGIIKKSETWTPVGRKKVDEWLSERTTAELQALLVAASCRGARAELAKIFEVDVRAITKTVRATEKAKKATRAKATKKKQPAKKKTAKKRGVK